MRPKQIGIQFRHVFNKGKQNVMEGRDCNHVNGIEKISCILILNMYMPILNKSTRTCARNDELHQQRKQHIAEARLI